MSRTLIITIDLDRLEKFGAVQKPTGRAGDLLRETLEEFAVNFSLGNSHSVWTKNHAFVGTCEVIKDEHEMGYHVLDFLRA